MDLIGLWGVFTTGLLTGGLSCLAVQGGLLATAIARPVEVPQRESRKRRRGRGAQRQSHVMGIQFPKDPWPIVYFLAAKLVAYTILGALLGALGSVLKITPEVQAAMLILAGIYMLVTALNMLNVHPIFRYFVIQPPRFLTRFVRSQAKSGEWFTPAFLGFLTVLIPCGITQAMEVTAISTGNALYGALILAVFVLGTTPTFFFLGFMATQVRGKLQPAFALISALLILGLGFWSVNSGLNLVGSPLALNRIVASAVEPPSVNSGSPAQIVNGAQEITINVKGGYRPNVFTARSGLPIRMVLVTQDTYDCSRAFVIPGLRIQRSLPSTGRTVIEIPAQQSGSLYFTCGMGMYSGVVNING